ncbi:MAG: 6-phosphofructokinase, partial [Butyricicoccus sp.]|nr:6-phosphofructokinase [Butyricicoccus sp.]
MEQKTIRRIGILTSGGDAPGMNSAIRAVVRAACAQGISVLGIRSGYSGLINSDIFEMTARSVDGLNTKGGTIL